MTRITTSLVAAMVAAAMLSAPVYAQAPKESTTEKIKTMTRAQWMKLQAGYKKEKARYTACNDKAKAAKLSGRKRWGSIYDCMTAG